MTAAQRALPRPAFVLVAAGVVAVASLAAALAGAGWATIPLVVAALVVLVLATLVAMRRDSRVLAPLAIALVALCNPVVLGGLTDHVRDQVGVVTVAPDRGLVLWATYPGIAGWDAPAVPASVDTTALAQAVPRVVRGVVDATGREFGWSWSLGDEVPQGARAIANGFGGASMFWRIDSPRWTTADFDGSGAQRAALLGAVDSAAAALETGEVSDTTGDVDAGDGVRAWTDGRGGVLTLEIAGGDVAVVYAGGPFLAGDPAEFAERMAGFAGLELPAPLVRPDLP